MANEKRLGEFDRLYRRVEGEILNGEPAFAAAVATIPLSDEALDSLSEAPVFIDLVHHEIHEGNTFQAWAYTGTVASSGSLDLVISTTGTAKGVHLTYEVSAGGDADVLFYEGITGTFVTAATVVNMNRISVNTSPVVCFVYPTVTVTGLLLNTSLLPGGTGSDTSAGGSARFGSEWILKTNTRYLIRSRNISASNQPMSIVAQWYQLD
jgi:hypothetical protein